MSRDLQRERADLAREAARAGAGREARLITKGVDFGVLRATSKGEIDASGIRGVDGDLVVKPFGWKGTLADFAEFASEALQVHMGIQSDRLLASGSRELLGDGNDPADPDGDGVRGELGRGPFAAMMAHLALLELPIVEPLIQDRQLAAAARALRAPTTTSFADDFQRGRRQFHALGCAACHVPMLVLESPVVEVEGLPPIDLSREMRRPAITYEPALGGYPVWLFSDLKRHDMGKDNAAQHVQRGVERLSHPATVGRRRFGPVPPRRPRPELRLRDRRPRRRGSGRPGGIRGAPHGGEGRAPRLSNVAPARAPGDRALIALVLRAPQHVEIQHADTHLPVDGMAE